ncbi:hypothetical protein BH24ACT3_BH24ACT3_08110 [soil metagenome]
MTRLFHRGELKTALLHALEAVGPANGYTVMQALGDLIGGGWRPSPGAVYPALLSLEDAGLIAGAPGPGSKVYELTPAGRRSAAGAGAVLDRVADRARTSSPRRPTLGAVLDRFAARAPDRRHHLTDHQARELEDRLGRVQTDIDRIINMRT